MLVKMEIYIPWFAKYTPSYVIDTCCVLCACCFWLECFFFRRHKSHLFKIHLEQIIIKIQIKSNWSESSEHSWKINHSNLLIKHTHIDFWEYIYTIALLHANHIILENMNTTKNTQNDTHKKNTILMNDDMPKFRNKTTNLRSSRSQKPDWTWHQWVNIVDDHEIRERKKNRMWSQMTVRIGVCFK